MGRASLKKDQCYSCKVFSRTKKEGDCIVFTGTRTHDNYPVMGVNYKTVKLTRLVWTLLNGPIPKGGVICHSCDNPPCINPEHLWLGTTKQNFADMKSKGRSARGEKNWKAKIDEAGVLRLRSDYKTGAFTYAELGEKYGMTAQGAFRIVKRKNWDRVT